MSIVKAGVEVVENVERQITVVRTVSTPEPTVIKLTVISNSGTQDKITIIRRDGDGSFDDGLVEIPRDMVPNLLAVIAKLTAGG